MTTEEDKQRVALEMTHVIVGARPLANKICKILDGQEAPTCLAALGIAVAAVTVDDNLRSREMSLIFVDVARKSALATFDATMKKESQ